MNEYHNVPVVIAICDGELGAEDERVIVGVHVLGSLVQVADELVVDVEEEVVLEVALTLFEVVDPVLHVREDLPLCVPLLAEDAARRVFIVQCDLQTVVFVVVLRDD